jgi:nicotinate phosphoribosyltransferase
LLSGQNWLSVTTTGGPLSTDLYELTMMAGYYSAGFTGQATFELYVRSLPPNRSYLVAAGLEQALDYLEQLHFDRDDIAHLRTLPGLERIRADFFDEYLPRFRFTGDAWAVPEGTPVFPPEPLLRITAPMPQAQLVETALLAVIGFQTSVASRAARAVDAAAGRPVADFGARRAHGLEAGVLAARAAFLAGCESTSNVDAGRRFGIPVTGTMAHSWVMAFPDELSAFCKYADIFGDAVMLVDTYDTEHAVRSIAASGLRPRAVRLDSGDLVALSRRVRSLLDAAGLRDTGIVVSSDLTEQRIADIVAVGAPIDGFGVGGALSTASDAPALGAIYKLVEIERDGVAVPIMKLSPGKQSYPGRKAIYRRVEHGLAIEDTMELDGDPPAAAGGPLLERVMEQGRRTGPRRPLIEMRARCLAAVNALPRDVRQIRDAASYPVRLGERLRQTIDRLSHAHR